MVMTERTLKEFLEAVGRRIQAELERLHEPTKKHIIRIVEGELRNYIAIGILPPTSFPVGMMHQDDYYGLDNEELSKKLQAASLGCDWDI